ncbi:MAG: MvaI/BcnI restriction endonuclease family protein [Firmicutes bacterium]|nr:MvaI/BcnI restriction endonuclease family protein [Bacillota bacterium]
MRKEINELKNKFYGIKSKGWIKSEKNGPSGVGCTFERLIGIPNNDLELPDFHQIEIKTKTKYSESYISLFNCTPTGPHYHEVERLKDIYGYPDSKLKNFNVLNTRFCSKKKNKAGAKFLFELKVDKTAEKLYLLIFDKQYNLIENEVYWDFDILKEKLYRKLKYLAYVKAIKKRIDDKKHFKYYEMKIYKIKDFETFINLLDIGCINISIKIGIYRDDKRKGKIHDHGTSFCIQEDDLNKLYDLIEIYK